MLKSCVETLMRICFSNCKVLQSKRKTPHSYFLALVNTGEAIRPWEAPITSKSRSPGIFCFMLDLLFLLDRPSSTRINNWDLFTGFFLVGWRTRLSFHTAWPKVDVTGCNHLCVIFTWSFFQFKGRISPTPDSIRLDSRWSGQCFGTHWICAGDQPMQGWRSSGGKANAKWTEEKFLTNSSNLDFQQRLAFTLKGSSLFILKTLKIFKSIQFPPHLLTIYSGQNRLKKWQTVQPLSASSLVEEM